MARNGKKQLRGKQADRVQLATLIMAGQDKILDEYCNLFEISKAHAVIEAIQLWLNLNKDMADKVRERRVAKNG